MTISRREFLGAGARALCVATLSSAPLPTIRRASQRKRVLIAGAGAAGLCAAYELQKAGHDVLVFEAKSMPGGRMHTLRAPFADGLYAEAGAMLFPSNGLVVGYAREFGVPLTPTVRRPEIGSTVHIAGTRLEIGGDRPVRWPVPLNSDEADRTLSALKARYHYTPSQAIEEGLNGPGWPLPAHLPADDMSLAQFWARNGASKGAIQLMRLGYFDSFGDGIDSVSALLVIRELASFRGSTSTFRIQGGSDLLPRAFAERLRGRVRYGAPLVAIRQDADGVEITIEDRAGRHQVRGDFLITTLPFPVLRDIAVAPTWSARRLRALREIPMTSITRVYLQCRERFWEATAQDGSAVTDLAIQTVYDATVSQPGPRGILESYTTGARARRLSGMTPDARVNFVTAEMTKVHPRVRESVEGGTSYSWDTDEWARGDWAYFRPGQIREFYPFISQPEGRIHFAGDLVGGIAGYAQGALLSARSVAEAVGRTA